MSDDYGDSDYEMGSEPAYSSGDEGYAYSEDEAEEASPVAKLPQKSFVVLDKDELRERLGAAVAQVVDLLCISEAEATRVLRFYKWDLTRLQEEWFADQEGVQQRVGLVDEQPATRRKEEVCKICFEPFPVPDMLSARCKHLYCKDCWRGYIHNAVDSGPSCLDLRCPDPGKIIYYCKAAVPRRVVSAVADVPHRARYEEFAVRSFVDDQRQIVWCPAPDCQNAVLSMSDQRGAAQDVFCRCGAAFCFNCKEEAHRPVDCETVRKWMIKNSAESENMTWILANTKPCPKCTRPIEKNQGCMHMTCSQCRHEFCWLCQGPWSEHGERTGGFYNCNKFKKAVEKGEFDEQERQRAHARACLERYMHYWHRWAENDASRKKALTMVKRFREDQQEQLSENTATPTSQLKFVVDAWMQVVQCRRVLKWTYATAYYAFADSLESSKEEKERLGQQQEFFEFNQGQAEHYLEKLHHKVEKELGKFITASKQAGDDAGPSTSSAAAADHLPQLQQQWPVFREQLIGLTDVTRIHFEKLVDEFEKGLDQALKEYDVPMDAAGTSAAAAAAAEEEAAAAAAAARAKAAGKAPAPSRRVTRSSKRRQSIEDSGDVDEAEGWECRHCTYRMVDGSTAECDMCGLPRQPS